MKSIKKKISAIVIITVSGMIGFLITSGIIRNFPKITQASQSFQFRENNYNQNLVDDLRFDLLYRNQKLQQKITDLKINRPIFANNFKINHQTKPNQFTITFADLNRTTAKQVIASVSTEISKQKQLPLKKDSEIKLTALPNSNSNFKMGLIGTVSGAFFALGLIIFWDYKRKNKLNQQ